MARIALGDGLSLHCAVDDYLWPWQRAAPVLMLSGDKSRIASEQQKILAERLPNGRLALFSGYGHGINLLVPERCARAALDFWHEVEATSALPARGCKKQRERCIKRVQREQLGATAMARLPYLDKSDLLPEHQDLLARNINLYRLLAHSPRAARSLNTMARYIRDGSRLDPRLRELAILQVGYATRSAYEYSHHIRISRDFDVSDDDIRAIVDETAGRPSSLEPLAKAVLRAARDLTRNLQVSDDTFAILQHGLDEERLTDLFITIAYYNGLVRLMAALQIDVEDEYLAYLDQFPLPNA